MIEGLGSADRRNTTSAWQFSSASAGSEPLDASNASESQPVADSRRLQTRLRFPRWKILPEQASLTAADKAVLAETERWSARIGALAHVLVVFVIGCIVVVAFATEHHIGPVVTTLLLVDVVVALFGISLARHPRLGSWQSWIAGLLDVTVLTALVIETIRFELPTPSPFKAQLIVIWGVFLTLTLSAMRGRPVLLLVQTALFVLSLVCITLVFAVPLRPQPGILSGSLTSFFDPFQSSIRIAVIVLAGLMLFVTTVRARINLRHAIVASRRAVTLSRYMAPSVASVVADSDLAALREGRQQNVAVLFCDVRSFSLLAETMSPLEIAAFLNEFRRLAVSAIEAEGGVIDKFIGDEVMGLFGVPAITLQDADRAIRAAQALLAAVKTWSSKRVAGGLPPVNVGIGIHYGPVFAGVLGDDRLEFTVIGTTVNIARRLEELTKTLDCECIVSDWAIREARKNPSTGWTSRALPAQTVRGHSEPIEVFALTAS